MNYIWEDHWKTMKKFSAGFLFLTTVILLLSKTAFSETFACMEIDATGYEQSSNMKPFKIITKRFILNVGDDLDWVSAEKIYFYKPLVSCKFHENYNELLCYNGLTRNLNLNTQTLKFVLAGIPTDVDDPFLSHGYCERF